MYPPRATTADRVSQDCKACGLLVWRMQTVIAAKAARLQDLKKAKEARAAKATKAHSKRWLKQEYGVELAGAIEAEIENLQSDSKILGACRADFGLLLILRVRRAGQG